MVTSEQQEVEFLEDNAHASQVNQLGFSDQQEWTIRDIVEFTQDDGVEEFSQLQPKQPIGLVRIYATRKSSFFVWNLFAVVALISALSMCPFSLDRKETAKRLTLSFTLTLTMVSFKFVTNSSLPKISYLTVLDKYILMSMFLMFITSVWHASINILKDYEIADDLDLAGFIIYAAVFFIYQIFFVIRVHLEIHRVRGNLKKLENQYKTKYIKLTGDKNFTAKNGGGPSTKCNV